MSLQRLKRLQRLEAGRRPDKPWRDPFEVAGALARPRRGGREHGLPDKRYHGLFIKRREGV